MAADGTDTPAFIEGLIADRSKRMNADVCRCDAQIQLNASKLIGQHLPQHSDGKHTATETEELFQG